MKNSLISIFIFLILISFLFYSDIKYYNFIFIVIGLFSDQTHPVHIV